MSESCIVSFYLPVYFKNIIVNQLRMIVFLIIFRL